MQDRLEKCGYACFELMGSGNCARTAMVLLRLDHYMRGKPFAVLPEFLQVGLCGVWSGGACMTSRLS